MITSKWAPQGAHSFLALAFAPQYGYAEQDFYWSSKFGPLRALIRCAGVMLL
jgi:hypothetical protein